MRVPHNNNELIALRTVMGVYLGRFCERDKPTPYWSQCQSGGRAALRSWAPSSVAFATCVLSTRSPMKRTTTDHYSIHCARAEGGAVRRQRDALDWSIPVQQCTQRSL